MLVIIMSLFYYPCRQYLLWNNILLHKNYCKILLIKGSKASALAWRIRVGKLIQDHIGPDGGNFGEGEYQVVAVTNLYFTVLHFT